MISIHRLRRITARHSAALSLTLVGAWALALYIHVIGLPFFRDDMVMLLWLQDMDWGRLWVDATGFLYYRPLSFSTLKLSELFFGYYHAPFLHVVNLTFHTANCIMVAMLTRRVLSGPDDDDKHTPLIAGTAAGLLFAAYPFTFEVIPTTGPIFQLQAAFFGLAAALAYAKYREVEADGSRSTSKPKRWRVLTLAMALLGAFTCEYGVLIPVMVGLVELLLWQRRPHRTRRPDMRVPLMCLAFTALYLTLWATVPKTRSADMPFIWLHDMDLKGLFYVQGLSYPAQWLALPIERAINPTAPIFTDPAASPDRWSWVVAGLGLGALAGLVWAYARRRRRDALAFGLALWGVAVVPTWVTLEWDYTWNGPRLLYLPAIGAALLWGGAIGLLVGGKARRHKRAAQALGLFVLLVTLGQNAVFLHGQAALVQAGGRAVDDTVTALAALPPGESALVVNFPSWLRPADYTYRIGTEGISFLPAYSDVVDLTEINARTAPDAVNLTFTNLWQPWRYEQRFYAEPVGWDRLLSAVRAADHVYLFRFDADGAHFYAAGRVSHAEAADSSGCLARFGARVQIDAARVWQEERRLVIALDWTANAPPKADWTVFVHLYDAEGKLVAQHDGYPLLGLMPLWAWAPGEHVHDLRYVDLPPDLPPGGYRVVTGVYDAGSGARVDAVDAAGEVFSDGLVPLPH